jgi:hypothetical protein
MAQRDRNRKLAEAIVEAAHDSRYDPVAVAHGLINTNAGLLIETQILQTLGHYCELLAIRYDYGDFNGESFPVLKQAAKIRDIIASESVGSA